MNDIIDTLGLHGVPKLFMLPNDIDHFQGKKAVIAIMASDRTHPEFKKAEQALEGLDDNDDIVVVAEDHPDGPLHERFHCKTQDFCIALIDKSGNAIMRGDQWISLQDVKDRLHILS